MCCSQETHFKYNDVGRLKGKRFIWSEEKPEYDVGTLKVKRDILLYKC